MRKDKNKIINGQNGERGKGERGRRGSRGSYNNGNKVRILVSFRLQMRKVQQGTIQEILPRTVKASSQTASTTEYIQGQSRNRGSVSALSAGAYTTTLYVMVDIVKRGGRAPTPPPITPGWANFYIITECTPESGNCHSVYYVASTTKNMQTNKTEAKFLVPDWGIQSTTALGLSYWPAGPAPMPESTVSPSQGQRIWLQNKQQRTFSTEHIAKNHLQPLRCQLTIKQIFEVEEKPFTSSSISVHNLLQQGVGEDGATPPPLLHPAPISFF